MFQFKLPIQWVIKRIEQANEYEVNAIVLALLQCYGRLKPDYELVILTLPKHDREARSREISMASEMLKKHIHTKAACL